MTIIPSLTIPMVREHGGSTRRSRGGGGGRVCGNCAHSGKHDDYLACLNWRKKEVWRVEFKKRACGDWEARDQKLVGQI